MIDIPDISKIASLVGDPARVQMLSALVTIPALTASELAQEAGITAQTATSHLKKLQQGGLIEQRRQGRHRYFHLANDEVAQTLENLADLAARTGHVRNKPGPKDPAMRYARVCYGHLAGDMGIKLLDGLRVNGIVSDDEYDLELTDRGIAFVEDFGIDLSALKKQRRPVCKACLDWSNRRSHLAGSLGTAIMQQIEARGWAKRVDGKRTVHFTPTGEQAFNNLFRA